MVLFLLLYVPAVALFIAGVLNEDKLIRFEKRFVKGFRSYKVR